jgi:hypothetical protein
VKNHFLREIIFGTPIAIWTLRLALQPMNSENWLQLALAGSIVVLPFWIAWTFGWFAGGMAEVWSGKVDTNGASFRQVRGSSRASATRSPARAQVPYALPRPAAVGSRSA